MKELIEKMREAGNKQFECTCNEAYKSRQMADPEIREKALAKL